MPVMIENDLGPLSNLEERKLKEIEHSRQRRSILRGYERYSDTNPNEQVEGLDTLIRDKEAFKHHFSNTKWYSVAKDSTDFYERWLRSRCHPGVKALDYCCGNGENGIFMALCGADTTGIDISPEGIQNARLNAIDAGVADHSRFEVMDGENMTFPDNTFDLVVVYGALHHVDYANAMSELRRVMKPTAELIAVEALKHNPIIHLYRRMTMHLRTEWEVDHILTVQHLKWSRQYFGEVRAKFFHLAVLGAVPFRKTPLFQPVRGILNSIDRAILKNRRVGKYAWIMVLTLSQPIKGENARAGTN
jgi:ubiquinone/menaquinone biosynthesis C-methylase UbiE